MEHKGLIPAGSVFELTVQPQEAQTRLDKYIADQFPFYSRSFFQSLIEDGGVQLNNTVTTKGGIKLKVGDRLQISFPKEAAIDPQQLREFDLGIKVIYQNDHFMVLEKPASIVVHRAPGMDATVMTLVDWILEHYHEVAHVGYADRPGIVHRLDKDTSGLIIITRTNHAHAVFTHLFKERALQKTYYAVVQGHPPKEGVIDLPIGRHPNRKICMKAFEQPPAGYKVRYATTEYAVEAYYPHASLVRVHPLTGRTHQIRVHLAAIGHPIIGDALYGESSKYIKRHALHATELSFVFDDKKHQFQSSLPADMQSLITQLQKA